MTDKDLPTKAQAEVLRRLHLHAQIDRSGPGVGCRVGNWHDFDRRVYRGTVDACERRGWLRPISPNWPNTLVLTAAGLAARERFEKERKA